ncbi:DUF503 domain-containing protein [Gordonia sp. ABSL1-1]|uniref:DUF503 domain-containing protein n=1 Tax=Gordonia sp. ABSL1-1 TaxID=3053923 RepID=UPI002573EA0B|nr:DUF503 domain-containing protein [Gordonia sp. ABSL1-1]MDL9937241.1 DUF503 domain-containing protein [Gordonia sp. ABSL1-1]
MWIGFGEFDLLLGDVHSLKEKRSVVRPIVADVRKRFAVSVGEVDHLDSHRRTVIGASVVAADRSHVTDVLDTVERFVAGRGEVTLLAARCRILRSTDI